MTSLDFYEINKTAETCSRVVWYVDYALKRMCRFYAPNVFKLLGAKEADPRIAIEYISKVLELNILGKDIGIFRNDPFHGNVDSTELAKFMGTGIGIILKVANSISVSKEDKDFYVGEINELTFTRIEEQEAVKKKFLKKLSIIKEERLTLFSNCFKIPPISQNFSLESETSPRNGLLPNFKIESETSPLNKSLFSNFKIDSPSETSPHNKSFPNFKIKKPKDTLKGIKGKDIGLIKGHIKSKEHRIHLSGGCILQYPSTNFEVKNNLEIINMAITRMDSFPSKTCCKIKEKDNHFILKNSKTKEQFILS